MKKISVTKKGFSLLEVLVFTVILSLFFVTAMSVASFNLNNMKILEHKIVATRYAEEGIEWLKQEKEGGWSDFYSKGSISGSFYCLNSLDWNSSFTCDEDYGLGIPSYFKREVLMRNSGSPVNQVDATVTVYWKEGNNVLNVPLRTVFKLLE